MSFKPDQFREVIRTTLQEFNPKVNSKAAIELLMLTAAQESHLGRYLYQDDGDVEIEKNLAAGVFQIEPLTFKDILFRVIIPKHPHFPSYLHKKLITDLRLSIIIARMLYWPHPQPLPKHNDVEGLARYYKKYFNTIHGKATVEEAVRNYKKYC